MTVLRLRADRQLIRARGASVRYLLASIAAPQAPRREQRMPVNIALVLDRSGSMEGQNKFPLAVEAVKQSLKMLARSDRFSLVVFDERIDVLMRSTFATPDAKRQALRALQEVSPRGSTDLCGGWMHACEQLSEHVADGTISRALLLTDGQANHGEVNHDVLAHHAAELNRRGIVTSAFGVGADFDERLLRDIANEGGGNFYFVQEAAQIPDLVTSEIGEALEVVIPKAALTLSLPRGVEATVLNRFRSRRANGRSGMIIELGDLVSGQELEVCIRLKFPLGEVGETHQVAATLDRLDDLFGDGTMFATFTYADHASNDEQPRTREVDREVGRVYAARARAEATEANRHGDFARARRALVDTSRHISDYAADDAELTGMAEALREDVARFAEERMDPLSLKSAFMVAESGMSYREDDGKARRARPR